MEIDGKIKLIGQTETFGSNGFRKRNLVVTTEEQYPQDILIEFIQDKCDLLNLYKVGENVKVSINLRGREYTNPQGEVKYFNSIQAWRIEKEPLGKEIPPSQEHLDKQAEISKVPDDSEFDNVGDDEVDDLPF